MQSNLLLIIPAYNEAENLVGVVDHLVTNYPEYDYVIVNDGSKDNTKDICVSHGYNFIDFPINLGLKSAFRGGLDYAIRNNYEFAMQYDGDGQHDPQYIKNILDTCIAENADIVIGSRFVDAPKSHSLRMMGSRIIEWCIHVTTGKRIKDPTSGMRLYNKKAMNMIYAKGDFGPEPDTVSHLMRNGVKVIEVQVEMKERVAGTSYLNFANSVRYMLHMSFSILIVEFLRKKEK